VAFRKLDVFGRGADEGLWHLFFPQSSGWSTWTSISGGTAIEGEPAAVLIQIGSTFLGGVRYFHSFTKIRRLTDGSHWIPSGAFDNCVSRGLGKPPNTVNDGSRSLAVIFFETEQNLNDLAYSRYSKSCRLSEILELSPISLCSLMRFLILILPLASHWHYLCLIAKRLSLVGSISEQQRRQGRHTSTMSFCQAQLSS
jgi:hypothetical protein